jgi:hypothetical protein
MCYIKGSFILIGGKMSDYNTDEIEKQMSLVFADSPEKLDLLMKLSTRISILEAERDKSVLQRMTYLTWTIANPLTLVFLPTIFSIAVELCINNWGSTYTEWSLYSLTKGANWTIPLLVSIIGLITGFGNKLYLIIQEKGDMSLLKELDARINGQTKRMDQQLEANRTALNIAEEQRSAEFKALLDRFDGLKERTIVLETKQEDQK